jgi:GrpB-like predicted nucleotidyltransferase (UPF0157 family)
MSPSDASGTPGRPARPPEAGLAYGTVLVADHDPSWAAIFDQLNQDLTAALGTLAVGIEHVGSTAVPGIKAKPIIDIAVGIRPVDSESVIEVMSSAGWLFRGDKGAQGGLLFVYEPQPQVRLAHAHAVEHGGLAWNDYLAFRDLLRGDPAARLRYEQTKLQLAVQFPANRAAYTAGKQHLVRQLMGR